MPSSPHSNRITAGQDPEAMDVSKISSPQQNKAWASLGQEQMGWGGGSKYMMLVSPLICTERLDPESLGSRIPVILLQAGAGPGGIGVDPTG